MSAALPLTVIPCAGKGERFGLAGYATPKTLLPMPDGRTLIEWVIDYSQVARLVTVAMREDEKALTTAIRNAHAWRPLTWSPIWLGSRPTGPLDSVLQAKRLMRDEELIINYCDCFLYTGFGVFLNEMRNIPARRAGLVGFENYNERFTGVPGVPKFKAGGIFWFRSGREFARVAAHVEGRDDQVGIPQVVYAFPRWAMFNGTHGYRDLGVPEDYQNFMAEGARI